MPERLNRQEITPSADRIADALKYATPESTLDRWDVGPGVHNTTRNAILNYSLADGTAVTLATDYRIRRFLGKGVEASGWGLKIKGRDEIYKRKEDIEDFLQTFGHDASDGKTEAQRVEAVLLHGIFAHGEENRKLPWWNGMNVEIIIKNAFLDSVKTAISDTEGQMRVYFPYAPNLTPSDPDNSIDAKMIQVITGKTAEDVSTPDAKEALIEDAKNLVLNNPKVRKALKDISYRALTLRQVNDGKAVEIIDPRGKIQRVELLEKRPIVVQTPANESLVAPEINIKANDRAE